MEPRFEQLAAVIQSAINVHNYLRYCEVNGLPKPDEVREGETNPPFTAPSQVVWRKINGTKLLQGVNLIEALDTPENAVKEVQFFLGLPERITQSWNDFISPPPPGAPDSDPVIGPPYAPMPGYFMNRSNISAEGHVYTQPGTGKRFVLVALGMFDRKWRAL